jgi:hypothetical protein
MRALVLCATLRPTGCKLSLSDCGRSSPSGRPFGRQRPRRKNVRGLAKFSLWPQRSAQKREDDRLTHTLCRCEKIVLQRRVVGAIRRLADGCPRAATRVALTTRFLHSFTSRGSFAVLPVRKTVQEPDHSRTFCACFFCSIWCAGHTSSCMTVGLSLASSSAGSHRVLITSGI